MTFTTNPGPTIYHHQLGCDPICDYPIGAEDPETGLLARDGVLYFSLWCLCPKCGREIRWQADRLMWRIHGWRRRKEQLLGMAAIPDPAQDKCNSV